ncbi:hypothetical protein OOX93_004084 [Salmonella enterica]|nr:hypothetical protein [Salmonella enterica]
MSKLEWLLYFRKFNNLNSLEVIIQRKSLFLNNKETYFFLSAADHRRAELIMGCLYDRVPKNIWSRVR